MSAFVSCTMSIVAREQSIGFMCNLLNDDCVDFLGRIRFRLRAPSSECNVWLSFQSSIETYLNSNTRTRIRRRVDRHTYASQSQMRNTERCADWVTMNSGWYRQRKVWLAAGSMAPWTSYSHLFALRRVLDMLTLRLNAHHSYGPKSKLTEWNDNKN